METNPSPLSASAPYQSADLSLVAGLAAIALDSALTNREADLGAVAKLAGMLGPEGQVEETVKKAMARIASRRRHEAATEQATNNHVFLNALQQLTRMATSGLSEFANDEIANLREFCLQLSLSARMPRSSTLLKLR